MQYSNIFTIFMKMILDYMEGAFHDDVCLLTTSTSFDLNQTASASALDVGGTGSCTVGESCTVSGWGKVSVSFPYIGFDQSDFTISTMFFVNFRFF